MTTTTLRNDDAPTVQGMLYLVTIDDKVVTNEPRLRRFADASEAAAWQNLLVAQGVPSQVSKYALVLAPIGWKSGGPRSVAEIEGTVQVNGVYYRDGCIGELVGRDITGWSFAEHFSPDADVLDRRANATAFGHGIALNVGYGFGRTYVGVNALDDVLRVLSEMTAPEPI